MKKVASTIKFRTRTTDICGRLGGDEFVILFPGVGHNEAEMLANGLLGFIRDQSVGDDDSSVGITSSIGIALFFQTDADDVEVLLAKADAGMYAVKRAGGDGVAFTTAPAEL